MLQVVFDSSFLMAIIENPTTWFEDMTELLGKFRPAILDCVLAELKSLARGTTRRSRYAELALQLGRKFDSVKSGSADVDGEIVSYALGHKATVATIDMELIRSLRKLGIQVVTLSRRRVALV